MFDSVKNLIVEQLGADPDKITPDTRFKDDLAVDSLDLMQLVMAFEDEFGKQIPDEKLPGIETVQDIVDFLDED